MVLISKLIYGIENPFCVCPYRLFNPIVIVISKWCFAVYGAMIMTDDVLAIGHDGAKCACGCVLSIIRVYGNLCNCACPIWLIAVGRSIFSVQISLHAVEACLD